MTIKKFCRKQGCQSFAEDGYCERHKTEAQAYDQYRESATKRGYNAKWRRERLRFLREHPLCKHCMDVGKIVAASVVDHIKPHKGDKVLFWDKDNWQPLCKQHHDIKTATEDGGFGR